MLVRLHPTCLQQHKNIEQERSKVSHAASILNDG